MLAVKIQISSGWDPVDKTRDNDAVLKRKWFGNIIESQLIKVVLYFLRS
jgi:hypothetical protein